MTAHHVPGDDVGPHSRLREHLLIDSLSQAGLVDQA
jgi:hypothetical protein